MVGMTCGVAPASTGRQHIGRIGRRCSESGRPVEPHPWCCCPPSGTAGTRTSGRQVQMAGLPSHSLQHGSCGWLRGSGSSSSSGSVASSSSSKRTQNMSAAAAGSWMPQVHTFLATGPLPAQAPSCSPSAWLFGPTPGNPLLQPGPGLSPTTTLSSSILPAAELAAGRLVGTSVLPQTSTGRGRSSEAGDSSSSSSSGSGSDSSWDADDLATPVALLQELQLQVLDPPAVPSRQPHPCSSSSREGDDPVVAALGACTSWEEVGALCQQHRRRLSPRATAVAILQLAQLLQGPGGACSSSSSDAAATSMEACPSKPVAAAGTPGAGVVSDSSAATTPSSSSSSDWSVVGPTSLTMAGAPGRSALFSDRVYTAPAAAPSSSSSSSSRLGRSVPTLMGSSRGRLPPVAGAGALPQQAVSSGAQGMAVVPRPINFMARPRVASPPQRSSVAAQASAAAGAGPSSALGLADWAPQPSPAAAAAAAAAAAGASRTGQLGEAAAGVIMISISPNSSADEGLLDNQTMQQRMAKLQAARDDQQRARNAASSTAAANRTAAAQQRRWSRDQQQQQEQLLAQLLTGLARSAAAVPLFDHMRVLLALARLGYRQSSPLQQLFVAAVPPRALKACSRDVLLSLAYSVSSLGIQPTPAWLSALQRRLVPVLDTLGALQQVQVVCSLQRLGWVPPADLAPRLAAALARDTMAEWRPQHLVLAIQVLSSLGFTPEDAWMAGYLAALKPHLAGLAPAQLLTLLTSLQSMSRKPDDAWLRAALTALKPAALARLTPQQWPVLLQALGGLGARPEAGWLREAYAASLGVLPQMRPEQLVGVAQGALSIGMQPPGSWVAALTLQCFQKMPYASATDLGGMGAAVAGLRAKPSSLWLQQWEARAAQRLPLCSGQQMAGLMVALVSLRHKPASSWMVAFEGLSHDQLRHFGPEGLAMTAKAMADLKMRPSLSWLYAFVSAAYGCLDGFSGQQLVLLFESLLRLVPESRWVDDLVQICSFEASSAAQEQVATAVARAAAAAAAAPTGNRTAQAARRQGPRAQRKRARRQRQQQRQQ